MPSSAVATTGDRLRVFIENEAGTSRKNIYDERTLTYLRTVNVSRAYPFPYGFVIGTRSGDGDCVDCFVLTTVALSSGTIVECDAVGLIEQIEDGEVDHKVLAVLPGEPIVLDDAVMAALKHFIGGVFAHVPGKRMNIGRLLPRPEAEAYVRACRDDSSPDAIEGP
jgi:inorganic pyrophosphatase